MQSAVIYRRVSSDRQKEEGKSLRDQEKELRDYCRAMGYHVVGNFEDAISGRREKTEKRAGLKSAIELVCSRKATLVAYDLDRLARSQSVGMRIVEQIHDCGGKIVIKSLGIDTNTPAGEMFVGIMFAVAQWGSRNIGEGVKRANRQTVATKGYRTQGRQPAGYKFDPEKGERVPCPAEQAILATVRRVFEENGRNYNRTAVALDKMGQPTIQEHRTRVKKSWHRETVKRLLGHSQAKTH